MNILAGRRINERGHLEIGGADATELAQTFGTPLYVFDEMQIRSMCRIYKKTIAEEYDGNGLVLYASKAFSCMAMYKIAAQEGIGVDVVSAGELYTAVQAGFPVERAYMHGNNKLEKELIFALESGIGNIVIDAYSEADKLNELCKERGMVQNVLIRINPGVEAHTHHAVQTATPDSKFGFATQDGSAAKIAKYVMAKENLRLKGFHCHIGSQIFEKSSFALAVDKCVDFMAQLQAETGFETAELNLGGGYGIWYTDEDAKVSVEGYAEYLKAIIAELKAKTAQYGLKRPKLLVEPGRSIVGEAGTTLYTVGAIKDIPGIKKYVAVDGGMFEAPRYALYGSKYTAILANRANDKNEEIVTIAGKCCESGDIVAANVPLPKVNTGDILAVLSTGAYHYSMASNYNRNFIPAAVLVKEGNARVIIKAQTFADLVRNDVIPEDLQ